MKFKNIKKKIKHLRFPRNSRIIPAVTLLKIYGTGLKAFTVFIFLLAVVVVGLDLQKNIQEKQTVDLEREKLVKELKFWRSFIAEHEDSRDAYFQASILEYKLGNRRKAKMYVEKGLSLDPNSKEGKKIEETLGK